MKSKKQDTNRLKYDTPGLIQLGQLAKAYGQSVDCTNGNSNDTGGACDNGNSAVGIDCQNGNNAVGLGNCVSGNSNTQLS